MPKVLIIYYTRTGNTAKMADSVEQGLQDEGGVEIIKKSVEDTSPHELLEMDGIILGSPCYYGGMASEMKRLLDESVKFHGALKGKVGAAFSSAANIGGGNETTILSMLQALLIHGMIVQGNPGGDHYGPVSIGKPDRRATEQCVKLGREVAVLVKRLAG
jgi:NAD(P)H dehydrogenase (quinone)